MVLLHWHEEMQFVFVISCLNTQTLSVRGCEVRDHVIYPCKVIRRVARQELEKHTPGTHHGSHQGRREGRVLDERGEEGVKSEH
jgi:hypothetical protein